MALMRSKRKASFSEDDVSLILQRYTATAIVTLLQEVSQVASCAPKIDWKKLVTRTATGITNAREYQMLWRHLAYREKLLDKMEENAEPLDDDSDLEFELEAVPKPSEESLSEAKVCVKIILNQTNADLSSTHNNTAGNDNSTRVPFDKQQLARISRGTNNNNGQATDQKPNLPSTMGSSVDAVDVAGSAPPKKKRKQWSKEEDNDLIALVQKYGEKWEILKDDFKHDRTPHQLAHRWGMIKKRQGQTSQSTAAKSTTSEERRLAHEAISHALGGFTSFLSGANNAHSTAQNNSSNTLSGTASEARPTSNLNPSSNPNQTLKSLPAVIPKPAKLAPKKQAAGASAPQPQPQSQPQLIGSGGPIPRPISTPNPNSIQAAAFAAGGRIANPSTARSLLEAAKSKNVVHIRSGSVSLSNKPIMAAHTTINLSTIRASASSVQTSNPNQNLNSSSGSGTTQASAHPNQNLNSSPASGATKASAQPNQNLNSSSASGVTKASAQPNQNLNSSPASGTAKVLAQQNQNLNSSAASGTAKVSASVNQNLNSSPANGTAKVSAPLNQNLNSSPANGTAKVSAPPNQNLNSGPANGTAKVSAPPNQSLNSGPANGTAKASAPPNQNLNSGPANGTAKVSAPPDQSQNSGPANGTAKVSAPPNQNQNSGPANGTAKPLAQPNQNLNSIPVSGTAKDSSQPTQNLNSIPASGTAKALGHPNQNLNSSATSGTAKTLAQLKQVTSEATANTVKTEVTQADSKNDTSKLNGDGKLTINNENLKAEEKKDGAGCLIEKKDGMGCLIGVEKTNGNVVSNAVKAVGAPETSKTENPTAVQTESKEKSSS